MVTIQHIGDGFPGGVRVGATRPWLAGEVRSVPPSTADDILSRHPKHFVRVGDHMHRAMTSPTNQPADAAKAIAGRHWKTLVAEIAKGIHDDVLASLRAQVSSTAVLDAIQARAQALASQAQQATAEAP